VRIFRAVALACIASAMPATHARAQTDSSAAPQTPAFSSKSTLVVVPAVVRTKAGHLVYTLNAGDFVVTDDGVPQKLHLEEDTGGEPLALVAVIEADAATRAAGWHPYTRTPPPDRFHALPMLIEAIAGNVPHRVAVVGFDSRPELELPFTSDLDAVGNVIAQLDRGNSGDHGAGILDSLILAVDLLRTAPAGYRRAILLLSETNDRGSRHPLAAALRAITETNTAVYSLAFSTSYHEASEYGNKELPTKAVPLQQILGPEIQAELNSSSRADAVTTRILEGMLFGVGLENPEPNPPSGCMGKDPTSPVSQNKLSQGYDCLGQLLPPLALARMATIAATDGMKRNVPEAVARLTGGEYFAFSDAKSLERDLATLANHAPNRYMLSFQPQSPHPGLHIVRLRLPEHLDLEVTARSSYWADTGQAVGP
jgi:VWFA-related protein